MMQVARLSGEQATGEVFEAETDLPPRPAAKRGEARAAKPTAAKRSAIAKYAARTRWKNKREEAQRAPFGARYHELFFHVPPS
jgi:hypothetical protein